MDEKKGGGFLPIILATGLIFILIIIISIAATVSFQKQNNSSTSAAPWLAYTEQWRSLMTEYCVKNGIPEYVDLMLSIMIEESGGDQNIINIMQVNGTIVSQEDSIDKGCAHFARDLATMKGAGLDDLATSVQSYNYGHGYVNYIASNGGIHTLELSTAFSESKKAQYGYARYGLPEYADHVLSRLNILKNPDGTYSCSLNISDSGNGSGTVADGDKTSFFDTLYQMAISSLGCPYVWGATGPSSFDCSGFTQAMYTQVSIGIPRTAEAQYYYFLNNYKVKDLSNASPGNLIFFTGTSNHAYISHVGIYIGNNQFIHASSSAGCVVIADLSDYYIQRTVGFGSYE